MARELVAEYLLMVREHNYEAGNEKLLVQTLSLYRFGRKCFPRSLVLHFNAIRVALHLGGRSDIEEALTLAESICDRPSNNWHVDPFEDIFSPDFFGDYFNYNAYAEAAKNLANHDRTSTEPLISLILASLHNYLGLYCQDNDHFCKAAELDPEFPIYKQYRDSGGAVQSAQPTNFGQADETVVVWPPLPILLSKTSRPAPLVPFGQLIDDPIEVIEHCGGEALQNRPVLVSALVSTYRSERFMRGLLDDLENQSLADKLEIVIIDSDSPENERSIVREYQRRFDNIVYVRTARRETSHSAINRALRLARGTYVTLANTDDRHKRDAFERMAAVLESRPDVCLVYANSYITLKENQTFERHERAGELVWRDFDPIDLLSGCYMGPQPMWRRSVHDQTGFLDDSLESAGDWEFWLRLAGCESFLHIDEFLGLYLRSPTSCQYRDPVRSRREERHISDTYLKRWNQYQSLRKQVELTRPILPEPLIIVQRGPDQEQACTRLIEQLRKNPHPTLDCPVAVVRANAEVPENSLAVKISPPTPTLTEFINFGFTVRYRYLWLLNPATLINPDFLEKSLSVIESDENICLVGRKKSSDGDNSIEAECLLIRNDALLKLGWRSDLVYEAAVDQLVTACLKHGLKTLFL